MRDEKKRKAIETYEAKMRVASEERSVARAAADAAFEATRKVAKADYDKAVKG